MRRVQNVGQKRIERFYTETSALIWLSIAEYVKCLLLKYLNPEFQLINYLRTKLFKYEKLSYLAISLIILGFPLSAQTIPSGIPLPSGPQLRWQQYEQIMFLCLDPCTWQGREYDNHSMPLSRINPTKLNTDQWCETAKLWDAKLILFVAKHTGGFCWWQTTSSEYGVKNTPWRNGKGDVLQMLSVSCKKYGLDLGVYLYPGDDQWGAGTGSGGTTKDPTKQEAYNQVFRQQLTEVLSRYGTIREVWFDGNCNITVNDILTKYATDAVIFQGKSANIRWVGNEDGYAPSPNWYTLKSSDLATGIATALHSDPYGDAYAPVETDVPLLKKNGHKWFWAPNTDHLLMDVGQFMTTYYKSVGRGGVLLLNSTPDTTGLIPESHVARYKLFGEEIKKRFSTPVKQTSGEGESLEILFKKPVALNHVVLQEDLSKGQRVLSYIIEGYVQNKWIKLYEGSSVGNKKIDHFNTVVVEKIRVRFLKFKGTPLLKNFAVYNIQSDLPDSDLKEQSIVIGNWQADTYSSEWKEETFDLTSYVNAIGQYDISFSTLVRDFTKREPSGLEFSDPQLQMYGRIAPEAMEINAKSNSIRLTRSQQTLDEFPTILKMKIRSKPTKSSGDITIKRLTFN